MLKIFKKSEKVLSIDILLFLKKHNKFCKKIFVLPRV